MAARSRAWTVAHEVEKELVFGVSPQVTGPGQGLLRAARSLPCTFPSSEGS